MGVEMMSNSRSSGCCRRIATGDTVPLRQAPAASFIERPDALVVLNGRFAPRRMAAQGRDMTDARRVDRRRAAVDGGPPGSSPPSPGATDPLQSLASLHTGHS